MFYRKFFLLPFLYWVGCCGEMASVLDIVVSEFKFQSCNCHHFQSNTLVLFGLAKSVECSPMARETWVQFQVKSYQRLKKWYLMPPWLTLSIIRYGSRVKWSNPGKEEAPSPTTWCRSYWKGSLRVTLDYGRQLLLWHINLCRLFNAKSILCK